MMLPMRNGLSSPNPICWRRSVSLWAAAAREQIIFNEISSGASGDLQQVTAILRKMIMEWG